jgi:hypothetical protein
MHVYPRRNIIIMADTNKGIANRAQIHDAINKMLDRLTQYDSFALIGISEGDKSEWLYPRENPRFVDATPENKDAAKNMLERHFYRSGLSSNFYGAFEMAVPIFNQSDTPSKCLNDIYLLSNGVDFSSHSDRIGQLLENQNINVHTIQFGLTEKGTSGIDTMFKRFPCRNGGLYIENLFKIEYIFSNFYSSLQYDPRQSKYPIEMVSARTTSQLRLGEVVYFGVLCTNMTLSRKWTKDRYVMGNNVVLIVELQTKQLTPNDWVVIRSMWDVQAKMCVVNPARYKETLEYFQSNYMDSSICSRDKEKLFWGVTLGLCAVAFGAGIVAAIILTCCIRKYPQKCPASCDWFTR